MIRLALCLLASPVAAQDARIWRDYAGVTSQVHIHEPAHPDAVASVTFQNDTVHQGNEAFPLEWGGIRVIVELEWQVDDSAAERITVYPPDGYIAIPPQLTVDEGHTMTLHIFPWRGM